MTRVRRRKRRIPREAHPRHDTSPGVPTCPQVRSMSAIPRSPHLQGASFCFLTSCQAVLALGIALKASQAF